MSTSFSVSSESEVPVRRFSPYALLVAGALLFGGELGYQIRFHDLPKPPDAGGWFGLGIGWLHQTFGCVALLLMAALLIGWAVSLIQPGRVRGDWGWLSTYSVLFVSFSSSLMGIWGGGGRIGRFVGENIAAEVTSVLAFILFGAGVWLSLLLATDRLRFGRGGAGVADDAEARRREAQFLAARRPLGVANNSPSGAADGVDEAEGAGYQEREIPVAVEASSTVFEDGVDPDATLEEGSGWAEAELPDIILPQIEIPAEPLDVIEPVEEAGGDRDAYTLAFVETQEFAEAVEESADTMVPIEKDQSDSSTAVLEPSGLVSEVGDFEAGGSGSEDRETPLQDEDEDEDVEWEDDEFDEEFDPDEEEDGEDEGEDEEWDEEWEEDEGWDDEDEDEDEDEVEVEEEDEDEDEEWVEEEGDEDEDEDEDEEWDEDEEDESADEDWEEDDDWEDRGSGSAESAGTSTPRDLELTPLGPPASPADLAGLTAAELQDQETEVVTAEAGEPEEIAAGTGGGDEGDEGDEGTDTVVEALQHPQFRRAVELVLEVQRASPSLLQRRLGVDFLTADQLLEQMEQDGIIGPYRNGLDREICMSLAEFREART